MFKSLEASFGWGVKIISALLFSNIWKVSFFASRSKHPASIIIVFLNRKSIFSKIFRLKEFGFKPGPIKIDENSELILNSLKSFVIMSGKLLG